LCDLTFFCFSIDQAVAVVVAAAAVAAAVAVSSTLALDGCRASGLSILSDLFLITNFQFYFLQVVVVDVPVDECICVILRGPGPVGFSPYF
jgi:hypothetical protein